MRSTSPTYHLRTPRRFGRLALCESPFLEHDHGRKFAGIAADLDLSAVHLRAYSDDHDLEGLRDPVKDWTGRLESVAAEIRAALP